MGAGVAEGRTRVAVGERTGVSVAVLVGNEVAVSTDVPVGNSVAAGNGVALASASVAAVGVGATGTAACALVGSAGAGVGLHPIRTRGAIATMMTRNSDCECFIVRPPLSLEEFSPCSSLVLGDFHSLAARVTCTRPRLSCSWC